MVCSLGSSEGSAVFVRRSDASECVRIWGVTAIDMCTVRQIYVVRPFLSRVLRKVSRTAILHTVAGLHGQDDQNSIPDGDKFLRYPQTNSSKNILLSIFNRL